MKRLLLFIIVALALWSCAKEYHIDNIAIDTSRIYAPSKEMLDATNVVFTAGSFQIRKFEENFVVSFELFEAGGKVYFADAVDTAYAFALAKRAGFEVDKSSINPKTIEDLMRFKQDAISELKEKLRDVTAKINADVDLGIEKEETKAFKNIAEELKSQVAQEKVRLGFLEYYKFARDSVGGINFVAEAIDIQDLLKRIKKEKLLAGINKVWVANPSSTLGIRNGILIIANAKEAVDAIKEYISELK